MQYFSGGGQVSVMLMMRKFQIFEKVIPATEPEDICQVVIMIIIPLEGPYMLRGKGQDDS